MFYEVIKTGKSGNCVIINDVMIDCGVPFSEIKPYLDSINVLLLTHIHQDHIDRLTLETIKHTRPDITIVGNTSVHEKFGVDKITTYGFEIHTKGYSFGTFRLTHGVQNTGYTWKWNGLDIVFAVDTGDLSHAPQRPFDYFFLECSYDAKLLKEMNEWAAREGRLPFTKFGTHLSRQEAEVYFNLYKRNDQSKLIPLHMSEFMSEPKTWALRKSVIMKKDVTPVLPGATSYQQSHPKGKVKAMNKLYLSYQTHTIEHYFESIELVNQLKAIGYKVYLVVNHNASGTSGTGTLQSRTFEQDAWALHHADIVLICNDGDDFNGAEFEIGRVSALMDYGIRDKQLFTCDLQRGLSHPLGELYVDSNINRVATIGAIHKHALRFESLPFLLEVLRQRLDVPTPTKTNPMPHEIS